VPTSLSAPSRGTARDDLGGTMTDTAPHAPASPDPAPRRTSLRSVAALVCLVLAAVLTVPAVVGFRGQRTLIDTQRYVATVGPLAAESLAIAKRQQVIRLRSEVESGTASVAWPADWPDNVGTWNKRWFLLVRDVLVMRHIDDDDITIRSLQLLQNTLRAGASAEDLIQALDHPPPPPPALSDTQWDRFRYGDLRIDIETIVA